MKKALWSLCCGLVAGPGLVWGAAAAGYPVRPVRLIVPFVAGGSSDIVARILGQALSEKWGQQIVVDDRPGAGTVIGTEIATKATPDGYTLVTANVALSINEALPRKLPYNALRDLQPLILIARQPSVLAAYPGFPANSVSDLIALAKKRDDIAYGSSGIGTIGHLAGELFKQMTGTRLTHVPYKGGGQLVTQVVGNQVPLGIMGLPPAMPHIKAGRLKVLAVTDGTRATALPNAPTIGETVPGFEVNNWIGILAPTGVPKAVVDKVYHTTSALLADPTVKKHLTDQGFEIWNGSPADFRKLIAGDIAKYTKVVKDAGIGAR
jgi:tripartite-type tricarboxylate transporter receptor subunit TctC